MGSTFSSLYYHLVFGTKDRQSLIAADWEQRLYSYLGGCLHAIGGKALAVCGYGDHVHLLLSLKPIHGVAKVVGDLKGRSSKWVHQEIGILPFGWQDGYGIFTVSASNLDAVSEYVRNQHEHHRARTFREEYIALLEKHGIEWTEEYLF